MSQTKINQLIGDEISRLAATYKIDAAVLEGFAEFVIKNHKIKPKPPKRLTLTQLKKAVYQYFEVKNTTELRRSGSFKMAADGMDDLDLSVKATWEKLYRTFVGVLPGEENQQGYGCINGVNIFDYFKPWQAFGLDPKAATPENIKQAYKDLSKKYHPDIPKTGDAKVFDRLNTMYQSISAGA